MQGTQTGTITAEDGTEITITVPKTTPTHMAHFEYKISIAMGKLITFEKMLTFAELETLQAKFDKVFSAHQNKEWWKGSCSATFTFQQAFDAEDFATAIHFYHGAFPRVSIDYAMKTITVSSPGYQAW
nr:hypothetical protein [Candidatus Sigynarchaeum springense]